MAEHAPMQTNRATVYEVTNGHALEVWAVDVGELLAGGDYTLSPPAPATPDASGATKMHIAAEGQIFTSQHEAAEALGISQGTVSRRLRDGQYTYVT